MIRHLKFQETHQIKARVEGAKSDLRQQIDHFAAQQLEQQLEQTGASIISEQHLFLKLAMLDCIKRQIRVIKREE